MEHLTTPKPPDIWIDRYKACKSLFPKDPMQMSPEEIRKEILKLLFDDNFSKKANAKDRELLTIIILQSKAPYFEFLKAYTTWRVFGLWEGEAEKNLQIDVEFRDNPQECIGNRLMHLLWAYNKKVVKEQVLYARTTPVEEGTLFPD
ncbi:hypothetical protein DRZ78_01775 [Candidatus Aerophobetes bacterium]|uniref:Uncharacterized protein n=1 Tax=Aerophobetes bacterium TaxID=2030807 RepID=A0A662D5R5_UNCAE|nr:MAG: hypothetical protein DRZ78_01775 [Candidatus Aerophobetes bacterium]